MCIYILRERIFLPALTKIFPSLIIEGFKNFKEYLELFLFFFMYILQIIITFEHPKASWLAIL